MNKKLIALVTSLSILAGSSMPAYASSNSYSKTPDTKTVVNNIKTAFAQADPKLADINNQGKEFNETVVIDGQTYTYEHKFSGNVNTVKVQGENESNVITFNSDTNKLYVDGKYVCTVLSVGVAFIVGVAGFCSFKYRKYWDAKYSNPTMKHELDVYSDRTWSTYETTIKYTELPLHG